MGAQCAQRDVGDQAAREYDGLDGGVPQGVAAVDGLAIAGTTAGSVYAVNATTGAPEREAAPAAAAPAAEGR